MTNMTTHRKNDNSSEEYEDSMKKEGTQYMTIKPRAYMSTFVCLRAGCEGQIGRDESIVANVGVPDGYYLHETYHPKCYKKVREYYND